MSVPTKQHVEAAAIAIVNGRAARRKLPPIVNALDTLSPLQRENVLHDAEHALWGAFQLDKGAVVSRLAIEIDHDKLHGVLLELLDRATSTGIRCIGEVDGKRIELLVVDAHRDTAPTMNEAHRSVRKVS